MANKNKKKGSNAEREYAQIFRDLGFTFCKTARQTSKLLDDCGIDLDFLPWNIQIKYGYDKGLNETDTLQYIKNQLNINFPPYHEIHKRVNILIHKKSGISGKKRVPTQELVFMDKYDFLEKFDPHIFLKKKKITEKTGQKRGWKFADFLEKEDFMYYRKNIDSKWLIVMTFKEFKKIIINKRKNG